MQSHKSLNHGFHRFVFARLVKVPIQIATKVLQNALGDC